MRSRRRIGHRRAPGLRPPRRPRKGQALTRFRSCGMETRTAAPGDLCGGRPGPSAVVQRQLAGQCSRRLRESWIISAPLRAYETRPPLYPGGGLLQQITTTWKLLSCRSRLLSRELHTHHPLVAGVIPGRVDLHLVYAQVDERSRRAEPDISDSGAAVRVPRELITYGPTPVASP